MISLFSNEKKVTASKGDEITVTNYRINYSMISWGYSSYESIFLEDVSFVKTQYKSKMIFLYLAGIALLSGLFKGYKNSDSFYQSDADSNMVVLLIGSAVVLVVAWLLSKSRVINIYSHSGEAIELSVPRWSYEEAVSFLEIVQLTKAQRAFELYKDGR